MEHTDDTATIEAWSRLHGPDGLAARVAYVGADGVLPARLPVPELARASVGVCSLAAAELLAARNGIAVPAVRVDEAAVATAFVSERHLRINGRAPTFFAPLSGFWPAADGWVRTHANYPHHRARLLSALGVPDRGDADALTAAVREALAARSAQSIEDSVYAAGGLAVAVSSGPGAGTWPLVEWRVVDGSPPASRSAETLPAAGVRVLDLTRVIAGPVATRTLALLGADVLRIDSPHLPEDDDTHAESGPGKRSAVLDLATPVDRAVLDELLETADVVVTGYRPASLDQYGLAADALLERRPDLIVAQLCAWGWSGPWSGRRGFDSLVQAASGIAAIEAGPDGRPGVLPAQALDHGTGYLLAAAILRALTHRHRHGGGHHIRLSLAGTASWLLHGIEPQPIDGPAYDPEPWLAEIRSPYGQLRYARSPVHYDGAPSNWARPPSRWGTDQPIWA